MPNWKPGETKYFGYGEYSCDSNIKISIDYSQFRNSAIDMGEPLIGSGTSASLLGVADNKKQIAALGLTLVEPGESPFSIKRNTKFQLVIPIIGSSMIESARGLITPFVVLKFEQINSNQTQELTAKLDIKLE